MKAGTRIQVRGIGLDWKETWEDAKIAPVRTCMLPLPAGYHPVRFADPTVKGGFGPCKLLVHENDFRVVSNRA